MPPLARHSTHVDWQVPPTFKSMDEGAIPSEPLEPVTDEAHDATPDVHNAHAQYGAGVRSWGFLFDAAAFRAPSACWW